MSQHSDREIEQALDADSRNEKLGTPQVDKPTVPAGDGISAARVMHDQAARMGISRSKVAREPRWRGIAAARSVEEQATRMGISRSYAYLLIKAGKLRSMRLGRRRLVSDADADALLAASREQVA